VLHFFLSACCPGPHSHTEQTLTTFSFGVSHFSTSVKDFLLRRELGFGFAMPYVQPTSRRSLLFAFCDVKRRLGSSDLIADDMERVQWLKRQHHAALEVSSASCGSSRVTAAKRGLGTTHQTVKYDGITIFARRLEHDMEHLTRHRFTTVFSHRWAQMDSKSFPSMTGSPVRRSQTEQLIEGVTAIQRDSLYKCC